MIDTILTVLSWVFLLGISYVWIRACIRKGFSKCDPGEVDFICNRCANGGPYKDYDCPECGMDGGYPDFKEIE